MVLRSEFDPDQKQLDLQIGFARGSRYARPACGAEGCGVYDVREKEWRHLNFFQHKTVLKASIPRVCCDKCGVKQVSPAWARTGSDSRCCSRLCCFPARARPEMALRFAS
ncbi:MAG: transposase family protein [Roseiarcus sp.]